MDYHSMKRSELQKLCKEHKIPANSANSVLADKLSELLNVKQKPKGRQRTCLKSPSEIINESESAVSRRQSRKVRFSPEVEYERSGKRQKATEPVITETRGRRKSVAKKADEPAVDNVNTETDNDVQIPVKVTRSRAHIVVKDDVLPTNERKQGRRANKEVEKEPEAVKETEGNGGKVTRSKAVKVVEKKSEPVKETVVATRATRSKGQTLTEDSKDLDLSSQVKETVVATRATRSKGQTVTDDSKDLDLSPQVKKKSGRPAKKDEQKVEPFKEVKDVPVRVTRARVQTSNDDTVVANRPAVKKRTRKDDTVVAIPPVEKKRTRRDTIDSSENLENKNEGEKLKRGRGKKRSEEKVAEVPEIQDNAGKGTRQTRRNKANVEDSTVSNQNESKVETVVEKKVTRSKASKTVQQLEEPVEEPAGRKNVNRRKSNIQPKKTEVVLPLEEPVNVPARKDTRRNSVVPKVQVKVSKKPPVAKKEKVKEAEKPQSPKVTPRKNVVKKQTKDASETETKASSSGKKSVAKKEKGSGVKSIESTKDASENEMKEVGSGSVSQKTKKRGGEPVIEEQTIDTEPVSTRKNSSAKKEQVSAVKTPVSRKRAKLSGIKESDSKDNNSMETPIRKMANLDLDDKVTENEKTPAIDESGRRFTRGAVTSNKKEPSQSAIKVQTARKTPGKFTRSGIKKQPSESTHESQPLSDAETVLPEDAEAKSVPDVTVTVVSEVPKEGNDKLLEQSVSEKSERTPVSKMENLEHDKVMENEKTPAIDQSGRRFTRGKSAIKAQTTGATRKAATRFTRTEIKAEKKEKIIESTQKSQPLNDAEIAVASEVSKEANDQILEQSGNVSASESTVDPLSDGSHVQNQNQEGEESVIPEISEKETELTKSGATSEGLENIASVEESFVSVEKTVVIEESVEIPLEQSDIIKGNSEEDIEAPQPSVPDDEDYNNVEDEKASNEKHNDDVADRVDDVEPNSGDTQELSAGDDMLQDLDTEEFDIEAEKITVPENLTTHSEPEKESELEPATVNESKTDNSEPANDVLDDEDADDVKEHESNTNDDQEVKSEKEQLTGGFSSSMEEQLILEEEEADPIQNEDEQVPEVSVPESLTTQNEPEKEFVNVTETTIPILGQSDDEDEGGDDVKEHEFNQEVKSEQEQVTGDFSSSMEEQHVGSDKAEPSQHADVPVLTQEEPCQHEDVPEVSVNTPDEEDSKPVVSLAADEDPSETVDAVEESEMDLMTSIELLENEQKALGTSGMDESTDFGLSDDQKTEEAELATEDDDMSEFSNQGVNPTIDQNSPVDKSKEEYQLPGDLGGYGGPTTEEEKSPTDDMVSEPPTSFKNEDRISQDWGNYSFGSEDDFQKPVSANESDDVGDQSTKDDQASSPAVATPTDKYYDWTDSSLKALLETQPPTQASHVKDRQQSTVGFTLPDEDDDMQKNATPCPDSSSLKALFETPAASKVSHVKDKQQIIPDEDDDTQYPDSSMKLLFKTPATTQVRHVKDLDQILPDEADDKEGKNATPYPDSSLKSIFRTPATSKVSHIKDKQQIIPDEDNTTQYPDSSMKLLFKTPATTQVRRVKDADQIIPDEDDGKNATPYPDSSSVLKSIFKTPATSQVRRVEQHTQQQSRVKFALPNQDVRAAEDPDSSLLKTPSHLKEHEQTSTVRFTLPEKDNKQGNATPIPYSSLKTNFSTPAATSHVQQQHEQSRLGFSLPDDQDSSLKTLFTTPATAQVRFDQDLSLKTMFATPATSHAYNTQQPSRGSFDALFGEGTKNQESSRLKTPATSQASHVKEHERSTVRFHIPDKVDSSLKSLFATPAPSHDDDDAYNNNTTTQFSHTKEYHTEFKAPQGTDPSLFATSSAPPIGHSQQQSQTGVGFSLPHHTFDQDVSRNYFGDEDEKDQMEFSSGTPGTTHNHAASGFNYSAKNHETQLDQGGSSMKELFKTPATTRISHVNEQQQSAVTFGFSQDSQNQGDPKNFTFEEFANKYFGADEEEEQEAADDGSFEFKQQAPTGTSHINTSQTDQGKGQA